MPIAEVCRRHGLSPATFYKLTAKYGGVDVSEAARLKALEDENAKLKRLLGKLHSSNGYRMKGRNGPFAIIIQRGEDIVYINATSTRECTFALGFSRECA